MSRTDDLTDADLGARIHAACEAQGGRIAVADRPFDPRPTDLGLPPAPALAHGSRRRLLAGAAVLVAVAGLAAAVVVSWPDAPDVVRSASTTSTPTATSVLPTDTSSWLVPATPPMGLDLLSVAWRVQADPTDVRGQLFVPSAGTGSVLVLVSRGDGDGDGDVPAPLTVRGRPASTGPSKEDGDRSTTIRWADGASIEARYVGMGEAEAVALLDDLRWRSDDHHAGFDPPADQSVVLLDEAEPGVESRNAELQYADAATSRGPGSGVQVQLHTVVADGATVDALQARLLAGGGSGDGSASSYDDEFGTLSITWPGRTAWIDANKTPVSEAQLRAVADDLVPASGADLTALRDGEPPAGTVTTTTAGSVTTSVAAGVPDTTTVSSGSVPEATVPGAIALTRLDGSGLTSLAQESDGKPVLVVLWASWCAPCVHHLAVVEEAVAGRTDVTVVAVAVTDGADDVRRFVGEHETTLPVLLDPDGELIRSIGVDALPATVIVDPDGRVLGSSVGEFDGPADVHEQVDPFVG